MPAGRVPASLFHGVADLSRPVSPLLHDYKQSAAKQPAKSKALQWFAVGRGIPLAGVALISGLARFESHPRTTEENVMMASDAVPVPVDDM